MTVHDLKSITDDELLRRLEGLVGQHRRVECELIAHIGEVDERRLYASRACSSMHAYCTHVLHLSDGEAFLRIAVARASRKYPAVLTMLRDSRIHLSGAGKLAPHLTAENCESVLARAVHKSKREIEELVAELEPKPDVPASVRKLPTRPEVQALAVVAPESAVPAQLRPDAVKNEMPSRPPGPPPLAPVLQPLAPERYKVLFTANREFRDKLERLQTLMDVDLVTALEAAVNEKLERLYAKRFAETRKPRKDIDDVDISSGVRYIPAPVRRIVCRRDGNQCTFVDRAGRRCAERRRLEFHHRSPYGRGGDRSPENLCLMCHAHNAYLAELDYGKEVMEKYRGRGRMSERSPGYIDRVPPALDGFCDAMQTSDA